MNVTYRRPTTTDALTVVDRSGSSVAGSAVDQPQAQADGHGDDADDPGEVGSDRQAR